MYGYPNCDLNYTPQAMRANYAVHWVQRVISYVVIGEPRFLRNASSPSYTLTCLPRILPPHYGEDLHGERF